MAHRHGNLQINRATAIHSKTVLKWGHVEHRIKRTTFKLSKGFCIVNMERGDA